MKKTRNTFFTEANMNYASFPNMGMPANMPVQSSTQYNSFYSGPNMNPGASMPNAMPSMPMQGAAPTDLESRLAKIERQITRLEHRISKLESSNTFITEDFDSTTNNMYML